MNSPRGQQAIGAIVALATGLALTVLPALAFVGPSSNCTPPNCGGAIQTNSSGDLSVGTTIGSGTRLLLIDTSTDTYGLRVLSAASSPLLIVEDNGQIGINTSSPVYALDVNGDIRTTGNLIAQNYSGLVSAENVTPGVFDLGNGSGNYSFPSNLGVGTSTNASLPAPLSVYGNGYVSGNLGIGTTTISAPLTIEGASGYGQIGFKTTNGSSGGIGISNASSQILSGDSSGQLALWNTGTINFSANGGTIQMVLTNGGNVGIGTTDPGKTLEVQGVINSIDGSGNAASLSVDSSGGHLWANSSYSTSNNGANWVDDITFNSSGNVSIPGTLTAYSPYPIMLGNGANVLRLQNQNGSSTTIGILTSGNGWGNIEAENGIFNGTITAGSYTGTLNAANVSAGIFGSNTGNGSFQFPSYLYIDSDYSLVLNNAANTANVQISYEPSSGNLYVDSGITMPNSAVLDAKNSSGSIEGVIWPRWSDNIMYLNYGSAGFNIRNDSSVSTMFMTNGGYVGIGTTNPGANLQVSGGYAELAVSDTNDNGGTIRLGNPNGSTGQWTTDGSAVTDFDFPGTLNIRSLTGGTNSRLTILSNGNVGIGTTSPNANAKLEVSNNGTTEELIYANPTSTEAVTWWANGSYGFGSGIDANNNYTIWGNLNSPSELLTITGGSVGGGNVGIGTTSPGNRLTIEGPYNSNQLLVSYDGSNGIFFQADGTTTHYNWQVAQQDLVAGLTFTPSTATGGTTFTTPVLTLLENGNASIENNLTIGGTLTAGTYTGTLNAANVSAGTFGSNTGSGNYVFPSTLTVGNATAESYATLNVWNPTSGSGLSDLADFTNGTDENLDIYVTQVGAAQKYSEIDSYSTNPLVLNDHSGGNVGIGTTNPLGSLDIEAKGISQYGNAVVNYSNVGAVGGTLSINNFGGGANAAAVLAFGVDNSTNFGTDGSDANNAEIRAINIGGGSNNSTQLGFSNWNGSSEIQDMVITSAGNVSINNGLDANNWIPTGYSNWSTYGTGAGGAAIYNDDGSYKTLMIVGSNVSGADGGERQVNLWDDLTVEHSLTVDNNLNVSGGTMEVGPSGSTNLQIDGNQVWALNNGAASTLYLNYGGGTVSIGGGSGASLSVDGNVSAPTMSTNDYEVSSVAGDGICFWNDCSDYTITMGNGSYYDYGPVTDYSIRNTMSNNAGRGWTWGANGVNPIAALSTAGTMRLAGHFEAGGGTPSISNCGTSPSVSGTDSSGVVTVGSGSFSFCQVNFATAFATMPACTVSLVINSTSYYAGETVVVNTLSTTALEVTVEDPQQTNQVFWPGNEFAYICEGT